MIIDFLFFFSMIFGYKLGLVDYSVLIPSTIFFALYMVKGFSINRISLIVFNFFIIFLAIVIIAIFSYIYNNGDFDPEYILKPLRNCILMFILYFFIKERNIGIIYLFKLLVYVFLVHSIVIYLQYILYYYDINKTFLYHPILTWSSPIRKVGLSTGFPSAGLMLVFSSLISIYLSFKLNSKLYFVISLIMGLSIFATGRSSMYIYILVTPFYLLYLSFLNKKYSFLSWYLIFCISIISSITFYFFTLFEDNIDKMFINIINYAETGSFHDYSSRHLLSKDHFYFPKTVQKFLLGNSLNKNSGFQPSDIGYVRITMSIGIFGMLMYFIGYIYLYKTSMNYFNFADEKSLKMLLLLVYLGFFAMSFKGHYIFSRLVGDSILIISFGYIFAKKEHSFFKLKSVNEI